MPRMKALRAFTDESSGRLVAAGSEFECSPGASARLASKGIAEPAARRGGRPSKAELLARAAELGVEVPEGATNPQIADAIDAAVGPSRKGRRRRAGARPGRRPRRG